MWRHGTVGYTCGAGIGIGSTEGREADLCVKAAQKGEKRTFVKGVQKGEKRTCVEGVQKGEKRTCVKGAYEGPEADNLSVPVCVPTKQTQA